jgi:hypothetical protein
MFAFDVVFLAKGRAHAQLASGHAHVFAGLDHSVRVEGLDIRPVGKSPLGKALVVESPRPRRRPSKNWICAV